MRTQEELREAIIRKKGNADPDPLFMAGEHAINAQAQPRDEGGSKETIKGFDSQGDRDFAVEMLRDDEMTPEQEATLMDRIEHFDRTQPTPKTDVEVEHDRQMAAASSRIDRTPTNPPQRQAKTAGPLGIPPSARPGFEPPSQENPDRQTLMENAAAQGVDVRTGLDARTRAAAGLLAFDGNAQVSAVDAMLRKDLQGVPDDFPVVFNDSATGELMFLRQQEDGSLKPTLINPAGVDTGDMVEFAGEVPTFVMETAGSIGGAIGGTALGGPGAGTVVGGAAGASAMAALSIPAREMFAKMMGVPPEVIDNIETADAALWQAGIAAGGELASFAVLGSITGMRNFLGRPLDVDDLPKLEAEIQKNLKKIKELEERTGARFNPTIGQLSADTDLQIAEANLRRITIFKSAKELRAAGINSQKASVEALESMATRTPQTPADPGFRSVEDVSGASREVLSEQPVDALTQTRIDAEDALTDVQRVARRDADLDELLELRNNVFAKAEKIVEIETKAWDAYRQTAGWDPKVRQSGVMLDNRGNTPIRQVMSRLAADGKESLLASLSNAHKATLRNSGFPEAQIDQLVPNEQLTGLAQETLDPFHLHMALSHMKRELRAVRSGNNPNGWEAKDMEDVITALELQMKDGPMVSRRGMATIGPARTNRIRDAWDHANDTTQELHVTFDTKNMQGLMETRLVRTGERTVVEMPNMPAGLIRKRLLAPGDARMLGEAMDVLGHEPRARTAMINEMRKLHADTVIKDGRFQQGLHNEFLDVYGDHMRVLGMEDKIDNIAGMGRVADDAARNLERIEGQLQQMYGRTVADPTKPLNIATELLSNRIKPEQAANIMRDLRRVPIHGNDLADAVEEKLLEEILQGLTGNKSKIVNSAGLEKMLRSNRDTLGAVFGDRYVKDLDLLNEAMEIMNESVFIKGSKEAAQSGWTALTRSLFGPLSKKQRFLTSAQRLARNSRAGRVADILEKPGALRQFVRLKNTTPRDPRYWITIQGLGLVDEALFNDDQRELYQRFSNGDLESTQREVRRRFGDQSL